MIIKIHGKFIYNISDNGNFMVRKITYTIHQTMVALMVRDIISFNGIFGICSLAKFTKLKVHLKVCH